MKVGFDVDHVVEVDFATDGGIHGGGDWQPARREWQDEERQCSSEHGHRKMSDEQSAFLTFLTSHETSTFYELADEFNVTPAEAARRFRDEAEAAGRLDFFLRSALLRQMHYYVPNGFRMHGEWKLIRALSSWVGMVGTTRAIERRCKTVGDAIQLDESTPNTWLPKTADDPTLVSFFDQDKHTDE